MINATISAKTLLKIDAFGAAISCFSLAYILVHYENVFGIPSEVLYQLAIVTALILLYDLYYLAHNATKSIHLRLLASINLVYCIYSLFLISYHYHFITIWGYLYVGGEISIILLLVYLEWTIPDKQKKSI